ncbi:MAG TPA: hypothetical protein VKA06_06905 [Spirochaetia bacterium]|nr:hypothetical protein [Spirochaetia bacterium]
MRFLKHFSLCALLTGFLLPFQAAALDVHETIHVGYRNDLAFELGFRLSEFSPELPVTATASGGYVRQVAAGNADDARSIFINDGTAGSPSEYGESWFYGISLGYELLASETFRLEAFGTGRQNIYNAYFIFTGGNEAFRVTTTQFGVGGGASLILGAGPDEVGFSLNSGVDYYFPSRIDSHGTFFYTPDGTDERPRNDYTYEDADASINQPVLRPYVSLGILLPL